MFLSWLQIPQPHAPQETQNLSSQKGCRNMLNTATFPPSFLVGIIYI